MKKLMLVIALAAGYCSYAQNAPAPAPTQGKVGYADVQYIISQLPEMKQIESDLKSTQTQLRGQIQAKSQELQKQYADFNAKAKTMPDTVRANRQKDLEKGFAELEQMQQDAQTSLQNKEKLFVAPLYLKVNRAIQEVAVENGYDIILTDKISGYDFLLFNAEHLNISNLVLAKFGVTAPVKEK